MNVCKGCPRLGIRRISVREPDTNASVVVLFVEIDVTTACVCRCCVRRGLGVSQSNSLE